VRTGGDHGAGGPGRQWGGFPRFQRFPTLMQKEIIGQNPGERDRRGEGKVGGSERNNPSGGFDQPVRIPTVKPTPPNGGLASPPAGFEVSEGCVLLSSRDDYYEYDISKLSNIAQKSYNHSCPTYCLHTRQ